MPPVAGQPNEMHILNMMDVLEVHDDVFDVQMALFMLDSRVVNGHTTASAMDLTHRLITHPSDVHFTCKVLTRVKTRLETGERHRRFVKMPKKREQHHRHWGVTAAFVLREPHLRKACGLETILLGQLLKNIADSPENMDKQLKNYESMDDNICIIYKQEPCEVNEDGSFSGQCSSTSGNAIILCKLPGHFDAGMNRSGSCEMLQRTMSCDSVSSAGSSTDSESSAWIVSPAHCGRSFSSLESVGYDTSVEMSDDEERSDVSMMDEEDEDSDENERCSLVINSGDYLHGIEDCHKEVLNVIRWTTFEELCQCLQSDAYGEELNTKSAGSSEVQMLEIESGESHDTEPVLLPIQDSTEYTDTWEHTLHQPKIVKESPQKSVDCVKSATETDELALVPESCSEPDSETTDNIIRQAYYLAVMSPSDNQEATDSDNHFQIPNALIGTNNSNLSCHTIDTSTSGTTNTQCTTDNEMKESEKDRSDCKIFTNSVDRFYGDNGRRDNNDDNSNDDIADNSMFVTDLTNDESKEMVDATSVLESYRKALREWTASYNWQIPIYLLTEGKVTHLSLLRNV